MTYVEVVGSKAYLSWTQRIYPGCANWFSSSPDAQQVASWGWHQLQEASRHESSIPLFRETLGIARLRLRKICSCFRVFHWNTCCSARNRLILDLQEFNYFKINVLPELCFLSCRATVQILLVLLLWILLTFNCHYAFGVYKLCYFGKLSLSAPQSIGL